MTETETLISKKEAEKMYLNFRSGEDGFSHEHARKVVLKETGHDITVPIKPDEVTPSQLTQRIDQSTLLG